MIAKIIAVTVWVFTLGYVSILVGLVVIQAFNS